MENQITTTSKNNVYSELERNCVNIIEAIEFFKEDGNYQSAQVDQLYNLPSIIAAKMNINGIVNKNIYKITSDQINDIGFVAKVNHINMIRDQMYAAISSNFERFLNSDRLFDFCFLKFDQCSRWANVDKENENATCATMSIKKILINIMFDKDNNSTISTFKDDKVSVDNTTACMEMCIDQLISYISAIISFSLNDRIDDICLCNENEEARMIEYISTRPENKYMANLYKVMDRRFAARLVFKQLVAHELFRWINVVLKEVISNIIYSFGMTNYYMIDDMAKFEMERALKDQNK